MPKPQKYVSRGKEAYRFRVTNPSTRKRVKISLGVVKESVATQAGIHLDALLEANKFQTDLPPAVVDWLSRLPDEIYEKVVAAGLVAERVPVEVSHLGSFLSNYLAVHGSSGICGGGWAESTATKRQQSIDDLVAFFGADRPIDQVTSDDARRWLSWMTLEPPNGRGLSPATASKKAKDARQFFEHAEDEGLIDRNPFRKLKLPRQDNPGRLRYLDVETVNRVLQEIADPEFRLVVALGRFAGFRIPSEPQTLAWSDVNFERKMIRVRSNKKAGDLQAGHRPCPLFDELLPFFEAVGTSEDATDGSVIPLLSRKKNANLRTAFERAVKRAGVRPWPRLFQNLRASALTDLAERYPLPQVCKWLGNSTRVAERHYFMLNQADSYRFGNHVQANGRQLITSRGYDSSGEGAKIHHAFSALQSEMYIDQLKNKVDRGMTDAFQQGKHVSCVPTGYKLETRLTPEGQPVITHKGKVERFVAIDEEAAVVIRRIFEMFSRDKLSPAKIAKVLDAERALGRETWGSSSVRQMLQNEKYIGRWAWKKSRGVRDHVTGKKRTEKNAVEDQLIQEFPDRRIISQELWDATVARLKEVSRDTKPPRGQRIPSRQEVYPSMLFDLRCTHCDRPLQRFRSSGKYIQLFCPNGKDGLRGCPLGSSKSLTIIEECLLTYVKQQLFREGFLEQLCKQANQFLRDESAKPPADTEKLKRTIATLSAKLARAGDRLGGLKEGVAADRLMATINEDEDKLAALKSELDRVSKSNFRPEALDPKTMRDHLARLRDLLQDDVVAAHDVLVKLVGTVQVSIGKKQGRTRTWMAEVRLDPIPALVEVGRLANCPTTHSLEFLQACSWTMGESRSVTIQEFPNYQRIAAEVVKMRDAGSSINGIAVALQVDPSTVKRSAEWAETNDVRFIPRADYSIRQNLATNKTAKISGEVARLRDQEGLTFGEIANNLGTTDGTASRAYKYYHANKNYDAVSKGEQLDTGANRRKIPQETIDEIRRLLTEGELSKRAIARQVNVTPWTVRHEAKKMSKPTK